MIDRTTKPVLHNYFRSSTSFRVRIALNMKGIEYDYVAHHLRKGEHRQPGFLAINPQGLLPSLAWSAGEVLHQSMAILEFLEEIAPQPAMLPSDPFERARIRGIANMIACDIHPVNNLRVLAQLRSRYQADEAEIANWFRHWVSETFAPLEKLLAESDQTGTFCHGETPTLADICLVPQVINNMRFGVDMNPYPIISRISETCMKLDAFAKAAPANQPDFEPA